MRRLQFDQFEFDSWQSEEFLEIVVAECRAQDAAFNDIRDFNAVAWELAFAENLPPPVRIREFPNWFQLRENLAKFAHLEIKDSWFCYPLEDDLLNVRVLIDGVSYFIAYHWYSTA